MPVAAYPVPGPADLIHNGVNGWIDEDLRTTALAALEVDGTGCRKFAEQYSWENCSRQFLASLCVFSP